MSTAHLAELRSFLKEFKATPLNEEYAPQAETVNALLPAMIDSITDEELSDLMNTSWEFILFNMLSQPAAANAEPKEEASQTNGET